MSIVHFITHPEVIIDPARPIPDWSLSAIGMCRMRLAVQRRWLLGVRAVFSSAERKVMDAAGILGDRLGLIPVVVNELGENDRSATGYLPKAEFDAVVDEFFVRPAESVRGWERAVDAQCRIIDAVESVMAMAPPTGEIAIVSHGGVGALLICHLKRVPISKSESQPNEGGGSVFSFDRSDRSLLSGWRRIEDEAVL